MFVLLVQPKQFRLLHSSGEISLHSQDVKLLISLFQREEHASFPAKIRAFFAGRFHLHVRSGKDTVEGKSLLNLLALLAYCCHFAVPAGSHWLHFLSVD